MSVRRPGWVRRLARRIVRRRRWFVQLPTAHRFYAAAPLSLLGIGAAAIAWVVAGFFTAILVFWGSGVLLLLVFGIGAALEAVAILRRIYPFAITKRVVGWLGVFTLGAATLYARGEVNRLTHSDPAEFPSAVAVLAVLATPLAASLITFLLFVGVAFLTNCLWGLYTFSEMLQRRAMVRGLRRSWAGRLLLGRVAQRKATPESARWLVYSRVGGALGLFEWVGFAVLLFAWYQEILTRYSMDLLVAVEFYPSCDCPSRAPGEPVKFLGGGRILVATPTPDGGYRLEERPCVP